jgi:hypothetical protein
MAVKGTSPIRFQGPPGARQASVMLPRAQPLFVDCGDGRFPLRASGDAQQITQLAFSMPDDTAPGESAAEVVCGDRSHKAVVTVLPRSRITVAAGPVALRARGGSPLNSTVAVRNRGNATVTLQPQQTVTLRPAGALARGVRQVFKEPEQALPERLIDLGRHLAAEASLELTLTVTAEAATLAPGAETRVSIAAAEVPDVEPGTAWTGRLALYGSQVPITLEREG